MLWSVCLDTRVRGLRVAVHFEGGGLFYDLQVITNGGVQFYSVIIHWAEISLPALLKYKSERIN